MRVLGIIATVALLVGAAIADVNLSQALAQIPTCTQECGVNVLVPAQCQLTDLSNCLCTNSTLQLEFALCVLESCGLADQFVVSSTVLQNEICKGVPIPSRSAEIIRDVIIISAFTYVIIGLRFYSRALVTSKMWWDDWAIALAACSRRGPTSASTQRLITMEPPHILSFPEDVLYKIFNHFQCDKVHRGLFDWALYDDGSKVQTVKTARLVCRLFNQLASPLLCPSLRLRLDHASLDFVDKVSQSPLIAAGVRNIEIVLDYRPRELATDLSRFKNLRKQKLREIHSSLVSSAEAWTDRSYEKDGGTIADYPYLDYTQTFEYISMMWTAWDKHLSAASGDGEAKDAMSLEFQRILRQGHQEYIQKHEEQFQLVTDGSFVGRLVSAISRMKHCASLEFVDDVDCYSRPDNSSPIALRDDARQIHQLMTGPLSWDTINSLEGGAETLPVRILWDLPIATHRAGSTLRAMRVRTFPHQNCCPMDCSPAWADLQAACQHLEVFSYGATYLSHGGRSFDPRLAREQALIERYLGAVLSSAVLEAVDLALHDTVFHAVAVSYRVGLLLRAISWPRMRNLKIADISLTQDELEGFCSGLGHAVEDICLRNVDVRRGSWAGALDMLRERVPKRRKKLIPGYNFLQLSGGEFGKKNKKLVKLAQGYVLGVGVDENPLRGTS
ncbi:hypothetical protein V500_01167 [Pseudogymnoascus sp. VKM F-4518 (FW-2643)]|nr:hypothetical protein V500_01167 [Pseudogymnoascus sp. VKM F-4518 (FW-2643)]